MQNPSFLTAVQLHLSVLKLFFFKKFNSLFEKMKLFEIFISAFNIYTLLNCANCIDVEDVVTKAVDEVQPHHLVLWKKLVVNRERKTKYFSNRRLEAIFNNLTKKVPTVQIDLNKPPAFIYYNRSTFRNDNFIYEYNTNISAPMHIFVFDDKVLDLNSSLTHLLEVIISDSIMYLSTPKCLFLLNQSN